jgi:hypothetical protein
MVIYDLNTDRTQRNFMGGKVFHIFFSYPCVAFVKSKKMSFLDIFFMS